MRPGNEATQTPISIYTSCQPFVNLVLPSSTCFQWPGERDTFTFVYISQQWLIEVYVGSVVTFPSDLEL